MNKNKFVTTASQWNRLLRDIKAAQSAQPVNDHLTDDEASGYAKETLSSDEVQRVDTHLSACAICAEKMVRKMDAAMVWDTEEDRNPLPNLHADIAAKMSIAFQWLFVLQTISLAAVHLTRTRRGRTRFGTDKLFQTWQVKEGLCCILHEDEESFVFTIDTTDPTPSSKLVQFTLIDAETNNESVTGLLALHPDPLNDGHFVASTRLAEDVILPRYCQPRVAFVELDRQQSPDSDLLIAAASTATTDADRRGWYAWAKQETAVGRLPKKVLEAIAQLCEQSSDEMK